MLITDINTDRQTDRLADSSGSGAIKISQAWEKKNLLNFHGNWIL